MGFMQKQIYFDMYFEVETTCGTEIVPSDACGRTCATHVEALLDYIEGKPLNEDDLCPVHEGWLARLSAPGYMDCTTWSAHETAKEASEFLNEMYGNDDPQNIDDLKFMYDCEWLEDRGRLSRVTTSEEESAWYCRDCGSLNVDSSEGICHECDESTDELP